MNDIMKYMHFGFIPEREICRRIMDKARDKIYCFEWYMKDLIYKDCADNGDNVAKARAFYLKYKEHKLLCLFLFMNPVFFMSYSRRHPTAYVFSKDWCFCTRTQSISDIWSMDIEYDDSVYDCLSAYDLNEYVDLKQYLKRYKEKESGSKHGNPIQHNFLIPLLSQYHKGLELLTKAKLYNLTKYLILCDILNDEHELEFAKTSKRLKAALDVPSMLMIDPNSYSNLKEWFGVSHKVLVKIDKMLAALKPYDEYRTKGWWYVTGSNVNARSYLSDREFFARLGDIQRYNPVYLNVESFTPIYLRLFMENHLIHKRPDYPYVIRRHITGLAAMKDSQIITILRYVLTLNEDEANKYFLYLTYCGKIGLKPLNYPYGIRPNPNTLNRACREASGLYETWVEDRLNDRFIKRVHSQKYQQYQYNSDDEGSGEYCIIIPKDSTDLLIESNYMGNCVSDYIENVANGTSVILFVREKNKPYKSFVTMEISNRNKLVQLKAKYNESAPVKVQRFIRSWAGEKGIKIATDDMFETS